MAGPGRRSGRAGKGCRDAPRKWRPFRAGWKMDDDDDDDDGKGVGWETQKKCPGFFNPYWLLMRMYPELWVFRLV